MQSVIDTNYTALITQVNRNDGLYWSGPYMTSAQSVKRDDSASKYRGTTVRVVKEAMVSQSRWAKVLLNNREVWIDKNGLRPLNQLANTRYVNYYAKINQTMRNDGLYRSGPYNTSANTAVRDDSAKKYHGYRIRVVAETDVNGKTRWAKIMLPNQQTYWIDKNGLK
ncbi:SH3-like domain-containing protein [Leuconostoc fallax]